MTDIRKHNVDEINLKIVDIEFWGDWEYNKGGMMVYWDSDIGYGTLTIVKRESDSEADFPEETLKLTVDTENMDIQEDKAFTRKILSLLVDLLIVEG